MTRAGLCAFAAAGVIPQAMLLDDDDDDPKRKTKRGVLPKQATQVMKSWLFQHIVVSTTPHVKLKF